MTRTLETEKGKRRKQMKYLVEKFNAEKRERTFGVYNQNAMDKYDDSACFNDVVEAAQGKGE